MMHSGMLIIPYYLIHSAWMDDIAKLNIVDRYLVGTSRLSEMDWGESIVIISSSTPTTQHKDSLTWKIRSIEELYKVINKLNLDQHFDNEDIFIWQCHQRWEMNRRQWTNQFHIKEKNRRAKNFTSKALTHNSRKA